MTITRWNGEPCEARRITAIVTDDGHFPAYWARDHVGTRRNAVEVTYGSQTFYLDDEDGSGWDKVTSGGSPVHAHRSLNVDPGSVQPRPSDDGPARNETTDQTPSLDDRVHVAVRNALAVSQQNPAASLDVAAAFIASSALAEVHRVVPGPAATNATELEKTARVFAGLHRSAEATVSRVINLHEQWVKTGPPPLGAPMARWWDARLAELHDAILPPADPTTEK
jgi:hypothetical protein